MKQLMVYVALTIGELTKQDAALATALARVQHVVRRGLS